MNFVSRWIGASIGLFLILYVLFFFLAIVGPIEIGDLLSWEGVLWVTGLSLGVGLLIVLLSPETARPKEPLDENELAIWSIALERLQTHRMRILSEPHPDVDFIESELNNDILGEIATHIAKSWDQAAQAEHGHDTEIRNERLAFSVSTFAKTVEETLGWIRLTYGSYSAYVDKLREDLSDCPADGYCHIIYGNPYRNSQNAWVQVCLMPFHGSVFKSVPILPIDLMEEELEGQATLQQASSDLVCDVCGADIRQGQMIEVPASRMSKLSENGYLPKRLPKQLTDIADTPEALRRAWRVAVSVNSSDWAACTLCAEDIDRFAHEEDR